MEVSKLQKIRAVGKLEEMEVLAHELDFYTVAGHSVHYKPSQAPLVPDLEPLIYLAVAELLRKHPTLFATPVVPKSKETPYFARLPSIDLRTVISFVQRQNPIPKDGKGRDLELDALLQREVNTNLKSDLGIIPAWRFVVFYEGHQFTANFMAHHGLFDGASFQIFHQSFHKALNALSASQSPESKVEYIILSNDNDIAPSLESIHPLPIPADSPKADAQISNVWRGNPIQVPCSTGYATLTLPSQLVQSFTQDCKKSKVPAPASLCAIIAKVLYSKLRSTIEAMDVVIPVDIRPELPPRLVEGVMGNFVDAFRTIILRSHFYPKGSTDMSDVWNAARKVQSDTRGYFANISPTGEAYMNIASLRTIPDLATFLTSRIGRPRTESLEVVQLGPYALHADPNPGNKLVWQPGKVTISRCALASGGCIQMTVVLHNEGMTIGMAWPKHALEDELVENTIDGIREYFDAI